MFRAFAYLLAITVCGALIVPVAAFWAALLMVAFDYWYVTF